MSNSADRKYWFGVLLVVVGALLLVDKFLDVEFPFQDQILRWYNILILVGFYTLFVQRRELGFIPLAIGSAFLVQDVFGISVRDIFEYWPVLLIVAGVAILLRHTGHLQGYGPTRRDEDFLNETNILGGQKTIITTQNFKGGHITNILGGTEIDLSQAELGDQEVVLDCFNLFGGCKVTVPREWTLKFETFSLLGGFTDERSVAAVKVESNPDKVLIVKGSSIFGGGEVRS